MLTRTLGRSGIQVSALGFGCWPIGGHLVEGGMYVGWGEVDDDESIRAIHHAMNLGVTFFDTANVYGRSEDILAACRRGSLAPRGRRARGPMLQGFSDRLLGKAFAGRRDQVVIAKFGKIYDSERQDLSQTNTSPENMRRSLEISLRRLQTDYIDLFQLHLGDCPHKDALVLREALEGVVQEGKIRGCAWSTDNLENAKLFAEGPHCVAIQQHLNLFEGNRKVLAFCEAHGLASINRGPLGMGLLTGKYTAGVQLPAQDVRGAGHPGMHLFPDGRPNPEYLDRLSAVREVLTSNGRTLAQGALA